MPENRSISVLFPDDADTGYRELSAAAFHDLGLDTLCSALTPDAREQRMIAGVISNMTADPRTAEFRRDVFADILRLPDLRRRMTGLFERIEFLNGFSSMRKVSDDENLGIWGLLHRLDDLAAYIDCIGEMVECLSGKDISSEGLIRLRGHVTALYEDSCFAEMKKDIADLKFRASEIRSVTVGINVNEKFEASSLGLISVNRKPFKKSGIVSNFAGAIAAKEGLRDDAEWNGDMHYHTADEVSVSEIASFIEGEAGFYAMRNAPFLDSRVRSTITQVPDGDSMAGSTLHVEKAADRLLGAIVRKLRDVLTKYVNVAVVDISKLIPEFVYYIRFAEFVEKYRDMGYRFCEAEPLGTGKSTMRARGFYNLKLALKSENSSDIVCNDLDFDPEHTVYILTGANRGGKTTVTQAVGLMFALAQGGICVPAEEFAYCPADCIYTHFPADEDKTADLGRLGEECVRFRDIYSVCTEKSLVLLNETFSTTSFEEGYYIARDSVRALLKKRVRTIYNTHMHKLAADTEDLNNGAEGAKASSLVVRSDGGKRSFKVEIAEPEGLSYAKDIAEKYGVTYEMLTG